MKIKMRSRCSGVIAAVLMVSLSAFAHHGTAAYDEARPVTLHGTVTEFNWANPHTQIYFDARDDKGNTAHWSCETLSPGKLARAGWSKDSLKAGDKITITLWPAKNGAPVGFLRKVLLADGKELPIDEKAN